MKTLHCAVRGSLAPNAMCGDVITDGLICGSPHACVHQIAPSTGVVFYWPDGTWCHEEEYRACHYSHKGDDFGKLTVPDGLEDAAINQMVDEAVS